MTNADMGVALSPPAHHFLDASLPGSVTVNLGSEMECTMQGSAAVKLGGQPRLGRETVARELQHRLLQFESQQDSLDTENENSFFIADLGEVYRQYLRWKKHLPRVEPFYAVKCNPDPLVLRLLASLGAGFDCASKGEIAQVLALDPTVPRRNIIYANPCKANQQIRYAQQVNVKMMTFDNADELYKCKQFYPDAELLLRIWTDDSKSQCQLSRKFGASEDTIRPLLKLASILSLNVTGVSFHVGSGSHDPDAFISSVDMARRAFDVGRDLGFEFSILDVGGGFCHDDFEAVARVLGEKIDERFPPDMGVRIIGEPGRYFVASAFTLATNVIARRSGFTTESSLEKNYMYYLSDGVYGSFNCILYDHQNPIPRLLSHGDKFYYDTSSRRRANDTPTDGFKCSIWGPTCDGLDCISPSFVLPAVLDVGDWLYFEDMGAYTICAATRFNGFRPSKVFYVSSEDCIAKFLGWD